MADRVLYWLQTEAELSAGMLLIFKAGGEEEKQGNEAEGETAVMLALLGCLAQSNLSLEAEGLLGGSQGHPA